MSARKSWVFLPILLMLFVATQRVALLQGGEAVNSSSRPDAPTYGARGSYLVGTRDLTVEGDTPLELTVWYPALNNDSAEQSVTYDYPLKFDMPDGMSATVTGQAIHDAPYDLSDGPYPLVILSPGFALGRTGYAWLGEHLASYGFAVIAPEHHERADETLSEFWKATITRPQEMQLLLAYVDAQTAEDRALAGLVDPQTVAVVGHSYGGYTALAAAGGRFDIDGFEARCASARAVADPDGWLCDLLLPHVADMAELAGFDTVPDGLWPSWADGRVDAIVPLAGDAYIFDEAGLAEISVPVMAMGGSADTGTPYLWGTYPTYEHVSSDTRVRVTFENAEHMIFGATCEAIPFFVEIGFYSFCSDLVWDVDRAHDLVNHFVTAFLLAELKQDADAAAALTPDAVTFPGVTYEAQGF